MSAPPPTHAAAAADDGAGQGGGASAGDSVSRRFARPPPESDDRRSPHHTGRSAGSSQTAAVAHQPVEPAERRRGGGGGGRGGGRWASDSSAHTSQPSATTVRNCKACVLVVGSEADITAQLRSLHHQAPRGDYLEQIGHACVPLDALLTAVHAGPADRPIYLQRQIPVRWLKHELLHTADEKREAGVEEIKPDEEGFQTLSKIAVGARDVAVLRDILKRYGMDALVKRIRAICDSTEGITEQLAGTQLAEATDVRVDTPNTADDAATSTFASSNPASASSSPAPASDTSAVCPSTDLFVLLNVEPATPSHGYPTRDVCMPGGALDSASKKQKLVEKFKRDGLLSAAEAASASAAMLDDTPLEAAKRELTEEMGLTVSRWDQLHCVCGSDVCTGTHAWLWHQRRPRASVTNRIEVFILHVADALTSAGKSTHLRDAQLERVDDISTRHQR